MMVGLFGEGSTGTRTICSRQRVRRRKIGFRTKSWLRKGRRFSGSKGRPNVSLQDKIRENREDILRIAAAYGASNVRVFGSVARGDDDEASDVDFLVELAPGCGLLRHAAMVRELEQLLGCRVQVVSDRGLRQRIRDRVLREAVHL